MRPLTEETRPIPAVSTSRRLSKRRAILLAVLIFIVLAALAAFVILRASAGTPAPTGTWTKTHIYSGSGVYKTDTITLSGDWRIEWACSTVELPGDGYPLQIAVYNTDGSLAATALNTVCGGNNTSGMVEIHSGGTVYLLVTTPAIWSFSVEELK